MGRGQVCKGSGPLYWRRNSDSSFNWRFQLTFWFICSILITVGWEEKFPCDNEVTAPRHPLSKSFGLTRSVTQITYLGETDQCDRGFPNLVWQGWEFPNKPFQKDHQWLLMAKWNRVNWGGHPASLHQRRQWCQGDGWWDGEEKRGTYPPVMGGHSPRGLKVDPTPPLKNLIP